MTAPQREARMEELQHHGFVCSCALCTLPLPALAMSERRRARVTTLGDELAREKELGGPRGGTGTGGGRSYRQCESMLREVLRHLRDEGVPEAWAHREVLSVVVKGWRTGQHKAASPHSTAPNPKLTLDHLSPRSTAPARPHCVCLITYPPPSHAHTSSITNSSNDLVHASLLFHLGHCPVSTHGEEYVCRDSTPLDPTSSDATIPLLQACAEWESRWIAFMTTLAGDDFDSPLTVILNRYVHAELG